MHRSTLRAFLLCSALPTCALAQTVLYVPDNQANAGVCNAIPLSASFAAAMTYVARIPATFLDPLNRTIRDIEFAPCSTTTFTAANLQMGIGHVPSPVPVPFTFPTFDAGGNVTSLGSFLDYSPFWNTVAQGPFSYAMTQDTWSPLGLATGAFTGFTWNGVDDIAFYLTYNTAAGGASCHRTATEPLRLYTSGSYQAASSTASGAAGLKMGLVTGFGAQCTGCGSLAISLSGSPTLGGAVTTTLGNLGGGVPFIGLGFGPFCFANYCGICPIGHSWLFAALGSTTTLNIPNNQIYLGTQVGFQGVGLNSPGGCQSPLVALSDTIVLTIAP